MLKRSMSREVGLPDQACRVDQSQL